MDKPEFEDRDLAAIRRAVKTMSAHIRFTDDLIEVLAVLAGGVLLLIYVLGPFIWWWHGVPRGWRRGRSGRRPIPG